MAYTVQTTTDVWIHKEPNVNISSRKFVAKKGQKYQAYYTQGSMTNLGGGQNGSWVETSYIRKVTDPATGSNQATGGTGSSGSTSGKATTSLDSFVAIGAGFLFIILIMKFVKKV